MKVGTKQKEFGNRASGTTKSTRSGSPGAAVDSGAARPKVTSGKGGGSMKRKSSGY